MNSRTKFIITLILITLSVDANLKFLNIQASNFNYQYNTITKLDAGKDHSGILTSEGNLFLWGEGAFGRLGNGSTNNKTLPTKISSLAPLNSLGNDKIIDFSLGAEHSSALTSTGRIFTWGAGTEGRLGQGSTANSSIPIEITNRFPSNERIVSIAMGGQHSAAITLSGKMYMWGKGDYGRIGIGSTINQITPIEITNVQASPLYKIYEQDKIVKIKLGSEFSGALTQSGKLFLWGRGSVGQLGNGSLRTQVYPAEITDQFTDFSTDEKIIDFALGREHALALSNQGKLYGWGGNSDGRVGNGTTTNVLKPVNITTNGDLNALGNEKISKVSTGLLHSGVISETGKVFLWGENNFGRLGIGSSPNQIFPRQINGFGGLSTLTNPPKFLALGWQHSIVSTERVEVFTFGSHALGQLGLGTISSSTTTNVPNSISALGDLLEVFNFNEATTIMNAIEALPNEPRIADKDEIISVLNRYQQLTQSQKNLVTNYSRLQSILLKVTLLIDGYQEVNRLIESLPNFIDMPDKIKIDEARFKYEELNDEQKSFINIERLIQAENDYQLRLFEIQTVIDNIKTIPNPVTLIHETLIQDIRSSFNNLTASQRTFVTNLADLLRAESQLQILYKEISDVISAINNLPDIDSITLDDETAVEETRAAYEALDEMQKLRVSNYTSLQEREAKIDTLILEIQEVIDLIDNLPSVGEITLNDDLQVLATRQAYENLHRSQKNRVTNYNQLIAVEEVITFLLDEINSVERLILSLPETITLVHREDVTNTRVQFNNLSLTQQARVVNVSRLEEAEAQIIYWEGVRDDFILKANAFSSTDINLTTYNEIQALIQTANTYDEVLRSEIEDAYQRLINISQLIQATLWFIPIIYNPWTWITFILIIILSIVLFYKQLKKRDDNFKNTKFNIGILE